MGIAVHNEVLGPVEQDTDERGLLITVLAVGGAGCKTLSRMHNAGAPGVQYYCLNTDRRSLERSEGPTNILLGEGLTGGLGTGGKPEVGRRAAEDDRDEILHAVGPSDLVLIVAGMGGGTGSGAAPVVAALAREAGAHVTAVVTKPFGYEAAWRQENAEQGISALKRHAHSLLVVHHDDLAATLKERMGSATWDEVLDLADSALNRTIRGVEGIKALPDGGSLDLTLLNATLAQAGTQHPRTL